MIAPIVTVFPKDNNYKFINTRQSQNIILSNCISVKKDNINSKSNGIYFNGFTTNHKKSLKKMIYTLLEKPITSLDTKDIVKARKKQARTIPTFLINTSKRKQIRSLALNEFYSTGAINKKRQLYFIIGLSGSGKSTVVIEPLAKQTGSFVADCDLVKEIIFKIEGKKRLYGIVHEESYNINTEALEIARNNGDNIIYPTSGRNISKLLKLYDKFKNANYDIHLCYLDVLPEKAAKRAVKRFEETGKFVDPYDILYNVGDKSQSNFSLFRNLRKFASIKTFSNNEEKSFTKNKTCIFNQKYNS